MVRRTKKEVRIRMLPANKPLPIRKLPAPPKIKPIPKGALPVAGNEDTPYAVERLRKIAEKAQAIQNILSKPE